MRVVEVEGRAVEVHVRRSKRVRGHRAVVAPGRPPEIVVRPRASAADIDAAIEFHRPWFARQLARLPEPSLGLDRLRLTEAAGRREAQARIGLIAQSEAMALGVRYARLVLAPHDVLDYVVVHEVCHLVEHNHGAAFWELVRQRRPAYLEPKAWLDAHGWEILAYRPPPNTLAA